MRKLKQILLFIIFLLVLSACSTEINVVFLDYDTKIVDRQTVKSVEKINEPKISRIGYDFNGWKVSNISETLITYKAEYTPKIYKIKFSLVYEELPDLEVKYDEIVTFPNVTKEAYKFKHWTYNNKQLDNNFKYIYDYNITAVAVYDEGISSYDEFSGFLQNADDLISNSLQYKAKIDMKYDITLTHVSFGQVDVSTNSVVEQLVDKQNNYYESKVTNDKNLVGYEILRDDNGSLLKDSLVKRDNHFIYLSAFQVFTKDFIYDDLEFNDGFTEESSYIKVKDNHYQTTTLLGNLTTTDVSIEDLAAMFNISAQTFAEIKVDIDTVYNEEANEFHFDIKFSNFKYIVDEVRYNLTMNMNVVVSKFNETITTLDYESLNLYYPPANSVAEITRTTDISNAVTSYDRAAPHYYRVELTEGVYSFNLSNIAPTNIEIVDHNLNFIKFSPLWTDWSSTNDNTFTIINSGTYYVKVKDSEFNGYWFRFHKQDYSSYSDYNNPDQLKANNFITIDGKFNYKYYTYNSTKISYLSFKPIDVTILDDSINMFDVKIYIYRKSSETGNYIRKDLNYNEIYSIPIAIGNNSIIIGSNVPIELEFTITNL